MPSPCRRAMQFDRPPRQRGVSVCSSPWGAQPAWRPAWGQCTRLGCLTAPTSSSAHISPPANLPSVYNASLPAPSLYIASFTCTHCFHLSRHVHHEPLRPPDRTSPPSLAPRPGFCAPTAADDSMRLCSSTRAATPPSRSTLSPPRAPSALPFRRVPPLVSTRLSSSATAARPGWARV